MTSQFLKWAGIFIVMLSTGCDRQSPVDPILFSSDRQDFLTLAPANLQPADAQLNLVGNLLLNANRQLDLAIHPPGPCVPSISSACPASVDHLQSTLDFYIKANGVLDGLAVSTPPGPPTAPSVEALDAILAQANISLGLIVNSVFPPGPPSLPSIIDQAKHTISVVNALKTGVVVGPS